jgi:hypothetical protein
MLLDEVSQGGLHFFNRIGRRLVKPAANGIAALIYQDISLLGIRLLILEIVDVIKIHEVTFHVSDSFDHFLDIALESIRIYPILGAEVRQSIIYNSQIYCEILVFHQDKIQKQEVKVHIC